jgi:hypothetical protein
MVTHSFALFLGPTPVNIIWNYLHFVVVAFVFCSGYVTYMSYKRMEGAEGLLHWYKKRFVRLYLPYAVYLMSYGALVLLFPSMISGRGISMTPGFFIQSLLFTDGVDVGWLTLLFIQFALLTPLLMWVVQKNKYLIAGLVVSGGFAAVTLLLRIPATYSRVTAWFPWLFIFLLGIVSAKKEIGGSVRPRMLILSGTLVIAVWYILTVVLSALHRSLTLTDHKYPPDVYYFLYGIGINGFLLAAVIPIIKRASYVIPPVTYISKHAYSMFFMHLIILDMVHTTLPHEEVILTAGLSIALTLLVLWGGLSFFAFSKNYISSVNTK